MCTVTYIPTSNNSFVLTTNRDEKTFRGLISDLDIRFRNGHKLMYPQDSKSGGSWIMASESGRVVCLLNGGDVKYFHNPPYKKSRGNVVLESFNYNSFASFVKEYDFSNIEPFTLLVIETGKRIEIFQFVWNGKDKKYNLLSHSKPHIWMSTSLYDEQVQKHRKELFNEWISNMGDTVNGKMWEFHKLISGESSKDTHTVPGVRTVSITQTEFAGGKYYMDHTNLITREERGMEMDTASMRKRIVS